MALILNFVVAFAIILQCLYLVNAQDPTGQPTLQPSSVPTSQPSNAPSSQPSSAPSSQPSSSPSAQPSEQPSSSPSTNPSSKPSMQPSSQPSSSPSTQPTSQPSVAPSRQPSTHPSTQPTSQPSSQPSSVPLAHPTAQPSCQPTSSPTIQPSSQPSVHPSSQPSSSPTSQPSSQPSSSPTVQPSSSPTSQPSTQPSSHPSSQPSTVPTISPSVQPSSSPTSQPSLQPSSHPSSQPSSVPSTSPSSQPSSSPTSQPSNKPSSQPSSQPSSNPTQPSSQPTMQPSGSPSCQPTSSPSSQPSSQPTFAPSCQPTSSPSSQPSQQPSSKPSTQPSSSPTTQPSTQPTSSPSSQPSCQPTSEPTNPTSQPSQQPTSSPSTQPTSKPSQQPTSRPTGQPSQQPIAVPTSQPSMQPSSEPSSQPTMQPSAAPSSQPTRTPSCQPSTQPSTQPSAQPIGVPTSQPSQQPTSYPTSQPSTQPSTAPTMQPTLQPTMAPSAQPSSRPSSNPSSQPTMAPSGQPSSRPSMKPSSQPSSSPSQSPSVQPSSQPSGQPTFQPTNPTSQPSSQPSRQPSRQPTSRPSRSPSSQPSSQPSFQPTSKPSTPTSHPTPHPTVPPTPSPTRIPTRIPTYIPTVAPSVTKPPTMIPTTAPSFSMSPSRLPTYIPTYVPSFSMSPSRAPTNAPTAIIFVLPIINTETGLSVSASGANSIAIAASFQTSANYAGRVNCAAYTLGKVPATVASVLQSTSTVSYVAGATSVRLDITTGLIPLTSYTVYCAVQGIDQASSTYANVLATARNVTTLCCKSVSFSTSPSFIYNDVSLYSRGIFSPVIFSFSLEAAPKDILIATAYLTNSTNGQRLNSSLYTISPMSRTFLSGTTSLSSSFAVSFLRINMTLNATVSVLFSGTSLSEYSLTPNNTLEANLQVLTFDATKVPAPQMKQVILGDSGTNMYIHLDSPSNRGGMSSNVYFPCSRFFSFLDASSTSCLFVNTSSVLVVFSSNRRTIEIGDSVTLTAGKFRASCVNVVNQFWCAEFRNNTQQTVAIEAPYNPVLPTPVIGVASVVNPCQTFTVNPTLSWGYAGKTTWKRVIWNVSTDSTGTVAAASYLQTLLQAGTSGLTSTRRVISVPANSLAIGNFFITLTLTNSLNAAAARTVSFVYGGAANTPLINIIGLTERTIYSREELFIQTNGTLSTCTGSSLDATLGFTWTLYDSTSTGGSFDESTSTLITSVVSTSNNPRSYLLPAYSLTTGNIYTVKVSGLVSASGPFLPATEATATITVSVLSGNVVSIIQGGSIQKISEDRTLDGSSSYDEDGLPLSYKWSCQIASFDNFGSDCLFIFKSTQQDQTGDSTYLTSSTVDVDFETLRGSEVYQVILTVTGVSSSNSDVQRVSTSSIRLSGLNTTSADSQVRAATRILVDQTTVNYDSYLVLTGFVQSPTGSALYATWSASQEEDILSLANNVALTATNVNISSYFAKSGITFQLKLFAGHLTIGGTTTFSLSVFANAASANLLGFAAVDITINGPPTGGVLVASPTVGTSLSTVFYFSTSDWQDDDDSSSIPLTYDFRYQVPPVSTTLFIQAQSPSDSAFTLLPNGQATYSHMVRVLVRAYDAYQANSTISTIVNVTEASANEGDSVVTVDTLLSVPLNRALNISNYNSALLVANTAASSIIQQVNCSLTPADTYCHAVLHRSPCTIVPNTCGNCESGYTGIAGPSNIPCYLSSENTQQQLGNVGDKCTRNADCLYNYCSNTTSLCSAPQKSCPSDCSGHGTCTYYSPSGIALSAELASECTVLNEQNCIAKCVCDSGFGGLFGDCSSTTNEVATEETYLNTICQTIVTVSNFSDISAQLLESLSGSLLTTSSAFSGLSTTSSICQQALTVVTALSSDGQFIRAAEYDVTENLLFSISNYVKPSIYNSGSQDQDDYYGSDSNSNSDSDSFVSDRLSSVIQGMLGAMANGETPVTYTSASSIQVQTRRDLASDFSNISLTFPQLEGASSISNTSSGSFYPTVEFVGDAGLYCGNTAGFVRFATATWSQNPFLSDKDASVANSTTSAVYRTEVYPNPIEPIPDTVDLYYNQKIMYYYTIPFTSPQTFSYTSLEAKLWNPGVNYTIPACTTYNPDTEQFENCDRCEISTYNNVSVTYACYDIRNICGKPGSTQKTRQTSMPSRRPTTRPSATPTRTPSAQPTTSSKLVSSPTQRPSARPSVRPSASPTRFPTYSPSVRPTGQPFQSEFTPSFSPTYTVTKAIQFLQNVLDAPSNEHSNTGREMSSEVNQRNSLPQSVQSWLLDVQFKQQQEYLYNEGTAGQTPVGASSRYLVSLTGDDDGNSLGTSNANVQQVAALLKAIANTFVLIISNNPFNENAEEAKAVLAFVSVLFIVMVLGTIGFIRWDRADYYLLTYSMMHGKPESSTLLKKEKKKLWKTYAAAATTAGGAGAAGVSPEDYHQHAAQLVYERLAAKHKPGLAYAVHMLTPVAFADLPPPPVVRPAPLPTAVSASVVTAEAAAADSSVQATSQTDDMVVQEKEPAVEAEADTQVDDATYEEDPAMVKQRAFEMVSRPVLVTQQIETTSAIDPNVTSVTKPAAPVLSARAQALYDIKTMLDTAIPISARLWRLTGWRGIWKMLSHNHTLSTMFYKPSMNNSRTMRWMSLCMDMGLLLFFDTLFFGIFFADVGTCETQLTESDCLSYTNHATGLSLCVWEGYPGYNQYYDTDIYYTQGTCSLQSPPGTLTFTLLLAAFSLLFALPFEILFDLLRAEILCKQPEWIEGSILHTLFVGCLAVFEWFKAVFETYLYPLCVTSDGGANTTKPKDDDENSVVNAEDLEHESVWETNRKRLQMITDAINKAKDDSDEEKGSEIDEDERKSDLSEADMMLLKSSLNAHVYDRLDGDMKKEIDRLRRLVIKRTKAVHEYFNEVVGDVEDKQEENHFVNWTDVNEELLHARMAFFHATGKDTQGEIDFLLHNMQVLMYSVVQAQVQQRVVGNSTHNNHAKTEALCHANPVHTALEVKAMERMLGIHIDGSGVELTVFESWLMQYYPFMEKLKNMLSCSRTNENHHHVTNSRYRKILQRKLLAVRAAADDIAEAVEDIPVNYTWQQDQNIALIRYFVLEQFTPLKRYVLEFRLFPVENALPGKINPFTWMFGWLFYIFWLLFFLIWIFQWGSTSGKAAFEAWGINFVLVIIQELLFAQIVLILVMYLIAMYAIEPQLLAIYRTLYRKALEMVVQEYPPMERPNMSTSDSSHPNEEEQQQPKDYSISETANAVEDVAENTSRVLKVDGPVEKVGTELDSNTVQNNSENVGTKEKHMNIVHTDRLIKHDIFQNMEDELLYAMDINDVVKLDHSIEHSKVTIDNSASTAVDTTLPAQHDGVLSSEISKPPAHLKDKDIPQHHRAISKTPFYLIQHMSPACRAAYRPSLSEALVSAKLLRRMTGADMELCKLMEQKPLHLVVLYFVAIPVLLGVFGQEIASIVISATLPTSLYLYIVVNYYLAQASVAAIVILYIGIFGFSWWRRYIQQKRRLKKQSNALNSARSHHGVVSSHKSNPVYRANTTLDVITMRKLREKEPNLTFWQLCGYYFKAFVSLLLYKIPLMLYKMVVFLARTSGALYVYHHYYHAASEDKETLSRWNAMNLPILLHGFDMSSFEDEEPIVTEREGDVERKQDEPKESTDAKETENSTDDILLPQEITSLRHVSWTQHIDKHKQPNYRHPLYHQQTISLPSRYFPTKVSPKPKGVSGYMDLHLTHLRKRYRVLRHNRGSYARSTEMFESTYAKNVNGTTVENKDENTNDNAKAEPRSSADSVDKVFSTSFYQLDTNLSKDPSDSQSPHQHSISTVTPPKKPARNSQRILAEPTEISSEATDAVTSRDEGKSPTVSDTTVPSPTAEPSNMSPVTTGSPPEKPPRRSVSLTKDKLDP